MTDIIINTDIPGTVRPIFLTNATCEAALEDASVLAEHGLEAGAYNGEFYPLTDAESQFIGEDLVELHDGFEAMTGYSVLYEGRKFLAPTVEFYFGEGVSTTEAEARAARNEAAEALTASVSEFGGRILVEEDMNDRVNMSVLIPFDYASKNATDFESWKQHLEQEIFAKAYDGTSPAP